QAAANGIAQDLRRLAPHAGDVLGDKVIVIHISMDDAQSNGSIREQEVADIDAVSGLAAERRPGPKASAGTARIGPDAVMPVLLLVVQPGIEGKKDSKRCPSRFWLGEVANIQNERVGRIVGMHLDVPPLAVVLGRIHQFWPNPLPLDATRNVV